MVSNNRPMLIQDVTIKKIPTAATRSDTIKNRCPNIVLPTFGQRYKC